MAIATVRMKVFVCDRCGHQRLPRGGVDAERLPTICASKSCHSPYWNRGPAYATTTKTRRGKAGS